MIYTKSRGVACFFDLPVLIYTRIWGLALPLTGVASGNPQFAALCRKRNPVSVSSDKTTAQRNDILQNFADAGERHSMWEKVLFLKRAAGKNTESAAKMENGKELASL